LAKITVKDVTFDIDLIIFDKDGTLVDFHLLWGARTRHSVASLVHIVGGDDTLGQALLRALGYETAANKVIMDGPLAVASMAKLYTIAASVLFQYGYGWHEAERLIATHFVPRMSAPPTAELIQPRGDVARLFRQLKERDIQIVVVTSDERAGTETALSLLGVASYVTTLICGDGDFPEKPAPDAIRHLASSLGLDARRMIMVGDTVNDMLFGANGGVAGCIGVLDGAGDNDELARHADVVVDSLDQIQLEAA
jgi:phosphoglycolate phosphatase